MIRIALLFLSTLSLVSCETFTPGRIDPTEGSVDGPKRTETGYYQGY